MRPFRFTAQLPDLTGPVADWRASLARLEDLGFSTVALADHFTGGYTMEPLVMLSAAASATSMRLQTAVLGVDYRHPVLLHRMAATLDVMSEGRLELGIGAGWMRSDYEAAGIPLDRPGIRIERLAETVGALKALFADEPVTIDNEHMHLRDLRGVPAPVQRPHPPFLIGGGGRRMLRFAGSAADIVGVNANLAAGDIGGHSVLDVSWERMEEKVAWVRQGAVGAGRDPDQLELSMAQWLLHVTSSRTDAEALVEKIAGRVGVEPSWLEDAPGVLVGSIDRVVEKLERLREQLGISYIQLHSGPHSVDLEPMAPVLDRLAGR